MSPHVSTFALERAVREQMSSARSLEQLRTAAGYDALQELTTQIQLPVWGIANSGAAWQTFPVGFDVQFLFAPEQRDSALSVPHFSYGAVVGGDPYPDPSVSDPNNPDSLVAVSAIVTEWTSDRSIDAIVGAVIGVGVSTLGGKPVRFDGYVHLTFQGFGAVAEDTSSDPSLS